MLKPSIVIVLVFLLTTRAYAAAFEPLGKPCRGFNVLASRVVTDPAGKEWFVLSNTNETTGVELIFIDFANNTGKTYRAPAGQGAWTLIQVPGGRLVVGTYYDGKFMIFDLKKMEFTNVIPFPGEEYFWNAALGSDGRLYGGTYPGAKLGALNLDTLTLEDCGAPAPPNLYCRNVSATPDGRILCNFVTNAQTTKLFDPKTKQWSDVPPQLKNVQRGVVWNDHFFSAGSWEGGKTTGPIAFKGENFDPVDPPPFPISPEAAKSFSVDLNLTTRDTLYIRSGNALFRYKAGDKEATKVFEQSLKSGAITAVASDGTLLGIRGQDYLLVKPGETSAKLLPIPVEPSPRPMHFVKPDNTGRLWGGPMFGQTIFWMDLASKKVTNTSNVCNSGGEVYDVAFHDGVTYAVAYVGGDVIAYDPAHPWDQLSNKNPRTIAHLTEQGYIRPVGGVKCDDGLLYSGWMAKYGTYGGAVAITDPVTGKTDLLENPLGPQAVSALDLSDDYLFVGTSLDGNGLPHQPSAQPQFGMIDRKTRKVVHQQPVDGEQVTKVFHDRKSGLVVAVIASSLRIFDPSTKTFTGLPELGSITPHATDNLDDGVVWFAQGATVVQYDLTTKKTDRFEAPAKIDHLAAAKDGTLFITCGPDLYRMTP